MFRWLTLAFALLVVSSGPALGQTAPEEKTVSDRLAQAITHYQRSEFDKALTLLTGLEKELAGQRTQDAAQVHTYLAFIHSAFGNADAAVASFEKALAINPQLTLDAPSPKIKAAFEQAQNNYRQKLKALDSQPPTISHTRPREAKHSKTLTIKATVVDATGVKHVLLHYRAKGQRGFSNVQMEKTKGSSYVATIPAPQVIPPAIEYYLEAWDVNGNGPKTRGNALAPIEVPVKGGPPKTSRPSPWYKKWWVWALAAGVVVAAGGVSAGIYLNRNQVVSAPIDIPGSLNPPPRE